MIESPEVDGARLKAEVKRLARQHGFPLVGITTAEPFPEAERSLLERIAAGLFAGLPWFTAERARFSANPRNHLPDARTLIALGVSYLSEGGQGSGARGQETSTGLTRSRRGREDREPELFSAASAAPRETFSPGSWPLPPGPLTGRVARYAWGRDYHRELNAQLKAFCADLATLAPNGFRVKTFVDTGRLVDRAVAQRAGLGWYGKNSNLLTHQLGSWVFLAEVLTNLPLPPDPPLRTHCGSCELCRPACPTGAIIAPGVVDNDRCISFLTIELRGPIPRHLRPQIGDWIFGCDLCQEVCPVNRKAPAAAPPAFQPDQGIGARPELLPLLDLTDDEFRRRFAGTPVLRAKRSGLLRNVCVALGNLGDRQAIPALIRALADGEPLVRGHAAWALGRLGGMRARAALENRLPDEADPWAREEIELALTADWRQV